MNNKPSLRQLKKRIETILEENPEFNGVQARNSDVALTILIWQRWYGVADTINVSQLFNLPHEDYIKRVRANLQNVEHKYLPTNPDVLIKRRLQEEYWSEALGYRLTKGEWKLHHRTANELRNNDEIVVRVETTHIELVNIAAEESSNIGGLAKLVRSAKRIFNHDK